LVKFGYDEIWVRFTVVTTEENAGNRIAIFRSSLSRAIKGYRRFKEHFLGEICPESIKIQFGSRAQSLLIVPYGFFDGLNVEQQNTLLKRMKSALKDYTSLVKFMLTNEKMIDYSDGTEVRALSGKELKELARFDFGTVIVVCGELYLFVDHHLFGTYFILEDPSLSLITVAEWGFISSLKLQDIHYEIKDYFRKVGDLTIDLRRMKKQCVPRSLGGQREKLVNLERSQGIIEGDLQEFTRLSNRIYEGIKKNEFSSRIWTVLDALRCLPHSLFQAYGIL